MATKVVCDRCGSEGHQPTQVLGQDLCGPCLADLREWLAKPMAFRVRKCGKVDRADQALRLLERSPTFTSEQVARLNGETRREAYSGAMHLVRLGLVRYLGRGVFGRVLAEAAE